VFYNKNKESNEEINKIMEKYDKEGFKQKKDAIESEIGRIKSDLDKKEKILKIYQDLNNIDDDGLGLKEIKSFLEFKKKEETAAEEEEERAPTSREGVNGDGEVEPVINPEEEDEDELKNNEEGDAAQKLTNVEAQDDDDDATEKNDVRDGSATEEDEEDEEPIFPGSRYDEDKKEDRTGKKYRKQPSILNLGLKNFI
jgi:hypothetical protein